MKQHYERPSAEMIGICQNQFLCMSNLNSVSVESYECDDEHAIVWNF